MRSKLLIVGVLFTVSYLVFCKYFPQYMIAGFRIGHFKYPRSSI